VQARKREERGEERERERRFPKFVLLRFIFKIKEIERKKRETGKG